STVRCATSSTASRSSHVAVCGIAVTTAIQAGVVGGSKHVPAAAAWRPPSGVLARLGFARERIPGLRRRNGLRRPPPLRQADARVLGYMIKRLVWAAVLFLIVTLYTYVLFFMVGPVSLHVGARGSGESGEASNLA